MPNDQFGRPVSVGDTVTLVGEVTKILEDPGYINCTVKLQHPMPPSGSETNILVNTVQLEKKGGGDGGSKGGHSQTQQSSQQPPPAAGAVKK